MTNCYNILGVKDFAAVDDIKTAYRKLSKKFHPDVNNGDKFFEERFKEIQNAYEILTDTRRRDIHDRNLKSTFSAAGNFDFNRQTTAKEETRSSNTSTENRQESRENNKTANTTSHASAKTNPTPNDSQRALINWFVGIVITGIVLIIVYAVTNEKKPSNNSPNNYNSSAKSSDYYSQPVQLPAYHDPEPNSYNNQNSFSDDEITPTSSGRADYFSLGSAKDDVLRIQGSPSGINKYQYSGTEVWTYGFSTVKFKDGRVTEYSNLSKNLHVKLDISQSRQGAAEYFTIGSTKDDVLSLQGTPGGIDKYEYSGMEVWSYEFSTVKFKNGRVSEYSNLSNNLNVELEISQPRQGAAEYFTIGSTKDDVLSAQGSPGSIDKYEYSDTEVWSYEFSTVKFQNGRVSEYSNLSSNLRIRL